MSQQVRLRASGSGSGNQGRSGKRARFLAIPSLLAAVAIAAPLLWGTIQVQQFMLSTELNVFVLYMGSPLVLVVPFLAAWVGNARLHAELGHRHVVNIRSRSSTAVFLRSRLLFSVVGPFAVFGLSTAVVHLVAFELWPVLGNPFIDPSINFLSNQDEVDAYEQSLAAFSQTMAFGSPAFGAVSALWSGFTASVYGAFAAAAIILLQNRTIGMLLPLIVYLGQSIAAALLVSPYAGLLYSLAPFGMQQVSPVITVLPTAVLAGAVALAWAWILRNFRNLPSLR